MHYFDSQNEEMDIHSNNNHIMMVTDQFITEAIQKGYILPEGRSVQRDFHRSVHDREENHIYLGSGTGKV